MTENAFQRPMRGPAPLSADEMGDVLASIRRLIAQDDGAQQSDAPAKAERAAWPEPAMLSPAPIAPMQQSAHQGDTAPAETYQQGRDATAAFEAEEELPFRLEPEALIPPAELPRHLQEARLRLTAASAVVDRDEAAESTRMAAIIRAATAARDRAEALERAQLAALAQREAMAATPVTPTAPDQDTRPSLAQVQAPVSQHDAFVPDHDAPPAAPIQPQAELAPRPSLTPWAAQDHGKVPAQRHVAIQRDDTEDDIADEPAPPAASPFSQSALAQVSTPAQTAPEAPLPVATMPESRAIPAMATASVARVAPVPQAKAERHISAAEALARIEAQEQRPLDDPDTTALHLFAPADEDIPNGSLLRGLLREAIRQELQGEMGTRFSRNLRQMIRQEVARAVADAFAPEHRLGA